ncbi:MAG: hypothetical protein R3199_10960 [Gemmatimonadota bacterium]|nr:hypothetical protein [Gemmatimonadota bacterium]
MTEDQDRDERQQQRFPFDGLHVYQRAQEAWEVARESLGSDPLEGEVEEEIRRAAIGIARASARSRTNGGFAAELENARGSLHAAAAIAEQLGRAGSPIEERLDALLAESAGMLGALIRSLGKSPAEAGKGVAA